MAVISEVICIQVNHKTSRKLIDYGALRGNGPFKMLMEVPKLKAIKSARKTNYFFLSITTPCVKYWQYFSLRKQQYHT